jgi:hypothetical protein
VCQVDVRKYFRGHLLVGGDVQQHFVRVVKIAAESLMSFETLNARRDRWPARQGSVPFLRRIRRSRFTSASQVACFEEFLKVFGNMLREVLAVLTTWS